MALRASRVCGCFSPSLRATASAVNQEKTESQKSLVLRIRRAGVRSDLSIASPGTRTMCGCFSRCYAREHGSVENPQYAWAEADGKGLKVEDVESELERASREYGLRARGSVLHRRSLRALPPLRHSPGSTPWPVGSEGELFDDPPPKSFDRTRPAPPSVREVLRRSFERIVIWAAGLATDMTK
jgi:hypothetical protein